MNTKPIYHRIGRAAVPALALFSFVFVSPHAVAERKPFEGSVQMRVEEGRNVQSIEYHVKGKQVRIEGGGMEGAMIMDLDKGELLMLMHQQRMYMRMPVPPEAGEERTSEKVEVRRTDDTREILGYQARRYEVRDGDRRMEVWGTEELGPLAALHLPDQRSGGAGAPRSALDEIDFFPLRVEERDERGQVRSRMEVTAVEQRQLPASMFAPPSGYQSFSIPALPNMEIPALPQR
jgi:hypothetical protein